MAVWSSRIGYAGIIAGAAWLGWRWYSQRRAANAANAAAWANVTTSAEELVAGQVPLALDLGGGIDNGVTTTPGGAAINPYTGEPSI
jgi:hypothetical protein